MAPKSRGTRLQDEPRPLSERKKIAAAAFAKQMPPSSVLSLIRYDDLYLFHKRRCSRGRGLSNDHLPTN